MLIAGLGNPGAKYQANRHNIGFMAVEQFARRHNFLPPKEKFDGLLYEGEINGEKMRLFCPQTFMNCSGVPLQKLCSFYKIPPEEVVVIYDELDLPLGKLRYKQGGGAGGHNGIKSIDSHLGKNYHRLRLGIDHPGHKDKVNGYVLSDFKKDEAPVVHALTDAIAEHATLLLKSDFAGFQNKIALAMRPFMAEKEGEETPLGDT